MLQGADIALKYEQIMNMPEERENMPVIRIFRQIPTETGLESPCLCGVPKGTVEMKRARSGH